MPSFIQRLNPFIGRIQDHAPDYDQTNFLYVDITKQQLEHWHDKKRLAHYPISTAKNGVGCKLNSLQTPHGLHYIAEKIGANEPYGRIFYSRQPSKQLATITTGEQSNSLDLITSRILWLSGLEPNINQGNDQDSYQRHIYIHGTQEEGLIGTPASHGCIRMKNTDIIDLFDQVKNNELVLIA